MLNQDQLQAIKAAFVIEHLNEALGACGIEWRFCVGSA